MVKFVPKQFRRVLVIGAGSLGKVYGVHLALHGVEVVFKLRNPSKNDREFRLRNKSSRKIMTFKPKVTTDLGRDRAFDAIFITTRSEDLPMVVTKLAETFAVIPPTFVFCPFWQDQALPHRHAYKDLYYVVPGVVAYNDAGVEVYRAGISKITALGLSNVKLGKDMAFLIHAAGLPCRYDNNLMHKMLPPSAALFIVFSLIELEHGHFRNFRLGSSNLSHAVIGLKEIARAMKNDWGMHNNGLSALLALPAPVLKFGLWSAAKLMPSFYREMLEHHTVKISRQTHLMMQEIYRLLSDKQNLENFKALVDGLERGGGS